MAESKPSTGAFFGPSVGKPLPQRKRLGEMLIEAGLITEDQLKQAIIGHKRANIKLGQYVIQQGLVSNSQVTELISKQLSIKKYRTDLYPLDVRLTDVVPLEMAQKYQIVPLDKTQFLLTIAMVDPTDINAMDAIEIHTNLEVEAVICSEQEYNSMLSSIYGTYTDIGGVLEDMSVERPDEAGAEPTEELEVSSLHDMAEEAPIVRLVNSILAQAVREGSSDVHISPEKEYVQVRFRVDGILHEVPAPPQGDDSSDHFTAQNPCQHGYCHVPGSPRRPVYGPDG